ncbi:MAG: phosphodiester glycosidase family protein [Phormidesmis sp.]
MQPDKRSRSTFKSSHKSFILTVITLLACLSIWKLTPPPLATSELETPSITAASQQIVASDYQAYEHPQATVHVVTVPAGTRVSIAVTEDLTTVETFARQENALAIINGGFFDPQNGKTTSHLIVQGQTIGDPADNERLMENPDLAPYISQILNRSEFRAYQCQPSGQTEMRYEIAAHNAPDTPLFDRCTLVSLLGAGPQLLPTDTSFEEGFTDYENGEPVRDAIGALQPNARSAIALKSDGSLLLIMSAQRPDAPGMTLTALADFARSLGAVQLLNLDGGSSSSLYYDGQTYLGRLDADGNPIQRPVKSVIVIGQ